MRRPFSPSLRSVAFCVALIFSWDQIVFAARANSYAEYQAVPVQPTTNAGSGISGEAQPQPLSATTTDFLLSSNSPFSPAQKASEQLDPDKIYDDSGKLRKEIFKDGTAILHVYEGESIAAAVNGAASGDTVYLHAGTYREPLILKQGVNLKGEDAQRTIVTGDGSAGRAAIRAMGDNRIENLTVTGARATRGQALGAISVEGNGVKVRENLITNNLCAGVYVVVNAANVLIEKNIFFGNTVAVKGAKSGNVIRYNTITGYASAPIPRISGIHYFSGRGFQVVIAPSAGILFYHIEYSDDGGMSWKRARTEISPGVFEDQKVPASVSGATTWVDDGSTTSPGPFDVESRWYRAVAAESFSSNVGIEVPGGQAPLIQNNIITQQKIQSIWESSAGFAIVQDNVLFNNAELGDATGRHLPPAIGNKTGAGWTNGNILANPQFTSAAAKDFSIPITSPAYGRGAFLPTALTAALERASSFNVTNTVEPISTDGTVTGYKILYGEGSHEEFYNDGCVAVDTIAPVVQILSTATLTCQTLYELHYTVDGIENVETRTLVKGQNALRVEASDIFGNKTSQSLNVTLDTIAPVIVFTSPSVTHNATFSFSYTVDGIVHSETRQLSPWENTLNVSASDAAGNTTSVSYRVNYLPLSLPDGTHFIYNADNRLRQETTPSGDNIFYDEQGRTERYRFSDGREIRYEEAAPYIISVYGQNGALIRSIDASTLVQQDTSNYLAVTLPDGAKAYYDNGDLKEIDTAGGIRILSVVLDAAQKIKDAVLIYPDKTQEIIWDGNLLRRVSADGSILDLVPAGFIVREIIQNAPQYYAFEKTSQTGIFRTKIFSAAGSSIYDELGILREAQDTGGNHFFFNRIADGNFFRTSLDRGKSSTVHPQSIVAGKYAQDGELLWLELENGTEIFFDAGKVTRAVDAAGAAIDYSSLSGDGMIGGLQIARSGTQFIYDAAGFLSRIITSQGTMTRIAQDTDHDGQLTDEDAIQLILDTVNGYKLTDFELDPQGNILRGILELQDGIKQYIQNGTVTGFETVDGRIYQYRDHEAVLQEWNFQDGTRVVYGGGTITDILYPDGKRLNTIGFNDQKEIVSYVEEIPDAADATRITRKIFANNKLITLILPNKTSIHYGADGLAVRIVLPYESEQTVSYTRNSADEITEIVLEGKEVSAGRPEGIPVRRVFKPEGTLVSILAGGVGAEMVQGEVSRLFTRFGSAENPTFDARGVVSSDFVFADGTRIKVVNGELLQAVRPTGTIVNYANGKVSSVQSGGTTFSLAYQQNSGGELTGIQLQISGQAGPVPLVPYLLAHEDSELTQILMPRPLLDSLADRFEIQSEFSTGDALFFAKLVPDTARETAYQLFGSYFPAWTHLADASALNVLQIGTGITHALIDLNGDGLPDRVYTDPAAQDHWWVQFNQGTDFEDPVRWENVDASFGITALRSYSDISQAFVMGDLIDMNGDGRLDRVINKTGEPVWYVQLNNGHGFDAAASWGGIQCLPNASPAANYALEVRDNQSVSAGLMDLDGDGLPDRILRPNVAPFDHWFFQKNTGNGFADAVLWEGIDLAANADAQLAASWSWDEKIRNYVFASAIGAVIHWKETLSSWNFSYNRQRLNSIIDAYDLHAFDIYLPGAVGSYETWYVRVIHHLYFCTYDDRMGQSMLIDMNGDGQLDRVLAEQGGSWSVQWNNGSGFDAPVLWDNTLRIFPDTDSSYVGAAIRYVSPRSTYRNILMDLRDVTGDGLPDRITVDRNVAEAPNARWWVEVNNGHGFDDAVAWEGIFGNDETETSIGQDSDTFQEWPDVQSILHRNVRSLLQDVNGDKIPDRLIYREAENRWLIQYGTGHGFLPAAEMQIQGLEVPANQINTTGYDYLHVSLKSVSDIPANMGSVRVTLGDPAKPDTYQTWMITDLTTQWQDSYLPLDKTKTDADTVKVEFIPAAGQDPEIPVYVDNVTFTTLRPPAAKDWLDRLLAEENIISEINSERTQTLAQYTGLTEASQSASFNWAQLLQAETRIHFDAAGQADQFQTLYGSVSNIENGHVTETTLSDGTHIEFSAPAGSNAQTTTQQVTRSDGTTEILDLAYGHVRSVSRSDASALEYSYEFDSTGSEITVVHDPDSGVTERYRTVTVNGSSVSQLISRTTANGVQTVFEYNGQGALVRSSIIYQGRVRETFAHSISVDGHQVITTEAGVREEYQEDGTIIFHTTADGYRYSHTYEQAKQVVITYQTVTETLPDGTTLTVQIPQIQLQADPEGDRIQVVTLLSYLDANNHLAEYGTDAPSGAQVLKGLKLVDGTYVTFERIEAKDVTDPQTHETRSEVSLLDATVFHADGTITEYKDGKPFAVVSAAGRRISLVTENGPKGEDLLIDPSEAAAFHLQQAKNLWDTFVLTKWNQYKLPAALPVKSEYTLSGELRVCQYADGTLELYNDQGKIEQVLNPDGERMIFYQYDAEGELIKIDMEGSRRRLESAILHLRADVSVEREKALAAVADRQQVLSQTLEGAYIIQRDQLLALRVQIEAQRERLTSINVKGKKGRGLIADAMAQIQAGIDQVNAALDRLAEQRRAALEQLASQVQDANLQIETESQKAYDDITLKADEVRHSILKQEIMPVVYRWYRKILGRDPNKNEYDAVIAGADSATGTFNLEGFKNDLRTGQEFSAKTGEVNAIRANVEGELQRFLTLSEELRLAYAVNLGIPASELITLSSDYVQKMCQWLEKQPIHFGQSAYIALEALLKDAGITFARQDIAAKLILIDILTGTLTPIDESDLLISVYAMKKVAAKYGLELNPLAMTYDALHALFNEQCPADQTCSFRLAAHISGNHYVIVTKVTDTEVSYIDPGSGPENALDAITIAKEDFLKIWLSSSVAQNNGSPAQDGMGYALSARPPPLPLQSQAASTQYRILDSHEQMSVRGAFLPFLIFIVAAIISAIQAVVIAVVAAITAIVGALVAGISSIAGAFGALASGIFSGNFLAGIGGLFQGILSGIGQIAGGVFGAIVQLGQGLIGTFTGLNGSLVGAISQGLGHSGFFGTALSGFFQSSFFTGALHTGLIGLELQGAGTLLDAIGVSPKFSQTLISGGQLVLGIGMLATGNPLGISFVAGGTSELLSLHTNLSPTLSGMIGIGAAAVSAFAVGFNGSSLQSAVSSLRSALPYLSMDLASAGLTAVGSTLDWNPALTGLINIPLRAAVGSGMNYWANGPGPIQIGVNEQGQPLYVPDTRSFLEYVTDFVITPQTLSGMVSIGLDLVSEEFNINPIFSALGLRLATAGVMGAINPNQSIISAMAEAFIKSMERLNPFYGIDMTSSESLALYFAGAVNFMDIVHERGLLSALESYATAIFKRDAVESIFRQGGLGDILTGRAEYTKLNGIPVKAIHIDANNDLYLSSTDDSVLLGRRIGDQIERGAFVVGSDGQFLLKDGVVETTFPDGLHTILEVKNGYASGYRVFSEDKELFEIYSTGGNQIALNPDGTIYSAVFINKVTGARLEFFEGSLVSFTVPATGGQNLNLSGMSLAKLTSIQTQALVSFVASNGIWNTRPEGVPPDYEINLMNRLVERGVDPASIFLAPMYENGNPVTDSLSWIVDALGADQLTNELMNKLDQKWVAMNEAQRTHGVTAVMYSGSTNPFLKAIDQRNYNVSTIIALGSPTLGGMLYEGTIENSNVRRFINVYGANDFVPLVGGDKSFTGPNGTPIENINIKILGADHFDYFPAADGSNKIGEFVARLSEVAEEGGNRFERFLYATPGISYNEESKTYIVNPGELIFDGGNT